MFRTGLNCADGRAEKAKMLGGLGYVRSMCCASFLGEFEPVSIKMAKGRTYRSILQRSRYLRPSNVLSGMNTRPINLQARVAEIGQEVRTAKGTATVVDLDILRRLVRLDFGDGEVLTVSAEEIIGSDPKA